MPKWVFSEKCCIHIATVVDLSQIQTSFDKNCHMVKGFRVCLYKETYPIQRRGIEKGMKVGLGL